MVIRSKILRECTCLIKNVRQRNPRSHLRSYLVTQSQMTAKSSPSLLHGCHQATVLFGLILLLNYMMVKPKLTGVFSPKSAFKPRKEMTNWSHPNACLFDSGQKPSQLGHAANSFKRIVESSVVKQHYLSTAHFRFNFLTQ